MRKTIFLVMVIILLNTCDISFSEESKIKGDTEQDTAPKFFPVNFGDPNDTPAVPSNEYFECMSKNFKEILKPEYYKGIKKEWARYIINESEDTIITRVKELNKKGNKNLSKEEISQFREYATEILERKKKVPSFGYDTNTYICNFRYKTEKNSVVFFIHGELDGFISVSVIEEGVKITDRKQIMEVLSKYIVKDLMGSSNIVYKDEGVFRAEIGDSKHPGDDIIIQKYFVNYEYKEGTLIVITSSIKKK